MSRLEESRPFLEGASSRVITLLFSLSLHVAQR